LQAGIALSVVVTLQIRARSVDDLAVRSAKIADPDQNVLERLYAFFR
jgi:hypothetical protein